MKASTIAALFFSASLVAASPSARAKLANRQATGTQTVPGLGARKQEVMAAGADTLDLAIAMLETDNMQSSFYVFRDGKLDDAANYGIFKQNWGMLRTCCSAFAGQQTPQFDNGAALNDNISLDVQCLNECQNSLGLDQFFGGHRNGASGLANPGTEDILAYRRAVEFIQNQLETQPNALTDDTRFFVQVGAI